MSKKRQSVLSLCNDDYTDVVNLKILWKHLRCMALYKRGHRNVTHAVLDSETLLLYIKVRAVMTSSGKSRRPFGAHIPSFGGAIFEI